MRNYVLSAFMNTPWAIVPEKLVVLEEIVARHVAGEKLSAEEIEARIHGATRPADQTVGSVAVLPLFGTIFPRANLMTQMSGATSADMFGKQFDQLVNDPNVSAIVLDVNSPGGQVGGIPELADKIHAARGKKPIVAVANQLMASAAYWVGTSASELVVAPSAEVGSIGVFTSHADYSQQLANDGVNVTLISAGKFKTEGHPYGPLSAETIANIQARVDQTYQSFVDAVARNRGVSAATVRNDFGEGRTVRAQQAVALGMADRVATLEETIARLQGAGTSPAASVSAETTSNFPAAAVPSDQQRAELERMAQSLRERCETILKKE